MAVVACVALAVAGYSQAALGRTIETHFKVITQYAHEVPYRLGVLGRVQAKRHKCVVHRRVDLYFNRVDQRHLRDSGWSSRNGTVGLKGRWPAVPHRVIVKVQRKRPAGRPYACSGLRFTHLGLTQAVNAKVKALEAVGLRE
jgi:hypothetical protein